MTAVGLLLVGAALMLAGPKLVGGRPGRTGMERRPGGWLEPRRRRGLELGAIRRPGKAAGVDARALALVLDLIAAVLEAGLPPELAVESVDACINAEAASALSQAIAPLRRVSRLLRWGSEPTEAWRSVESIAGYESVGAAGRRCAHSGARLAGALRTASGQLRAQRAAEAIAKANRVGIWSLLPLGLCFLPAFVCLGVVPVIAGLATKLLTTAG